MKTYSCIIIDDEPLARSLLVEYLRDFAQITLLAECDNGFEGVKAIGQLKPDFIFLDIQMPKINGFEMLELLDEPPAVIFTTAFDTYAMKAFEANAIDYLLKPFSKDRFDKALHKLLAQLNENKAPNPSVLSAEPLLADEPKLNRLVVKHNHLVRILDLSEVLYLEAYGDYIKIHTADTVYLKKKTMSYFETALSPQVFVRVHRSYIIPSGQIQKIDPPDFVILKTGQKIPISKTGYGKLKQALGL